MRCIRPITLASVCLMPAFCASTVSVDGRQVVELASPAASPSLRLTQACAMPVAIRPDMKGGQLSTGLTERLWSDDRGAVKTCERHLALARFIAECDAALAGTNIRRGESHE